MSKHPLFAWLIAPFFFFLVACAVIRLCLLGLYADFFATLSTYQIVQAFMQGMRFDLSISAVAYAPFLLALLVVMFFHKGRWLTVPILWAAFVVQVALWGLCVANLGYFGEVYRPLGDEVLMLVNDVDFVITLMTGSRWLLVVVALGALGLIAWMWSKTILPRARAVQFNRSLYAKVSTGFLAILITFLSIRGFELSSRPLSISDAYVLGNEAQAALMMNGAFSVVHNSRRAFKEEVKAIAYLNEAQMQQTLADNQMLPFNRVVPNYYDQPRNVVLILLESWSYQYIDGLSGNDYGVTPYFDSIVEKSMVWSNAYAAGQRSIEGMQAVLTSVPLLEGRDTIGFGLEQNRLTKIATEANRAGYNTVFMQTSKRRSFQVNAVAGSLGFDHYFGLEDFPEYKEYPEESRFGWDHDGLSFFAEYLARPENQAKPYFGFFFTGTTHEPFPNPGAEFHAYPHDSHWQNRYLNTLKYSDWALQEFMSAMQAHPSYMNTTFIFVADHALRASIDSRHSTFHIPLVIYAPDGSLPAQIKEEYVSQYDLLPTLDSLLGLEVEISTFGRSLLTEDSLAFSGVLSKQGNIATWMSPQGWLTFDAVSGTSLEFSGDDQYAQQAEVWSKARLQLVDRLLTSNAWAR